MSAEIAYLRPRPRISRRIEPATLPALLHVIGHMREVDHREVYALRWYDDNDAASLAGEMLRMAPFCWVAHADDGEPAYAFAVRDMWPGVCALGGFGTDRWKDVLWPVTRFTRRLLKATLTDGFVHRVECVSLAEKIDGHRWLRWLGAESEAVLWAYGRHREDYIRFVWR